MFLQLLLILEGKRSVKKIKILIECEGVSKLWTFRDERMHLLDVTFPLKFKICKLCTL